ncbi:MAG: hypothetical protein PHN49_07745 [Candidatus Omnitrophica bacterium]|nr:hypothetical protein [Candidatus Omnitrophota bacterium]MDD5671516.1 hypothetical protein [Candidatus Omnitrophota bacterium]
MVFNGSPRAEYGNTHVRVDAFLEGAREAGAEVVRMLKVSDAIMRKLEKPLVTDEQYMKGADAYWDKSLTNRPQP